MISEKIGGTKCIKLPKLATKFSLKKGPISEIYVFGVKK